MRPYLGALLLIGAALSGCTLNKSPSSPPPTTTPTPTSPTPSPTPSPTSPPGGTNQSGSMGGNKTPVTIKDSGDATGMLQSKSWSLKVLSTNVTTFTVTLNLSGTQGSPIPPVAYVVLEIKDSSNKVVASSSTASNPTTQKLSLSVKKEDIKNMGDWTITLRTDGSAPGGQAGIFHWEIFAVYIP